MYCRSVVSCNEWCPYVPMELWLHTTHSLN